MLESATIPSVLLICRHSRLNGPPTLVYFPLEIVHAILNFVERSTALALATVSRAWNDALITHRIYRLHIPLYRSTLAGSRCSPPAPRFNDARVVLERAIELGRRVVLELNLVRPDWSRGFLGWRNRLDMLRMESIFRLLPIALRSSIVVLHITVPCSDLASEDLERVLTYPAPLLTELTCDIALNTRYLPKGVLFSYVKVPINIFDGDAPNLRTITFRPGTKFINLPAPAFRSVVSARICCSPDREFNIAAHFPSARTLDIDVWKEDPSYGPRSIIMNFEGTSLQKLRLVMREWPGEAFPAELTAPLPNIDDLEISGFRNLNIDANLATVEFPCTLAFNHAPTGTLTKAFAKVSWPSRRLLFGMDSLPNMWNRVSQVFSYVTELRFDQRAIETVFNHVSPPVKLPVLTTIVVAIVDPELPPWPSLSAPNIFQCPALERIHFEWDDEAPDDTRLSIDVDAVIRCFEPTQRISVQLQEGLWTRSAEPDDSFEVLAFKPPRSSKGNSVRVITAIVGA